MSLAVREVVSVPLKRPTSKQIEKVTKELTMGKIEKQRNGFLINASVPVIN